MNTSRRLAATIIAPLILLTATPGFVHAEFRSFDDVAAAYLDARDKYAPLFPPLLPLPVEKLMDMSLAGDWSFTEDPAWFHVRPDGPFPFRARSRDFRGFVNDTLLLVFEDIASGRLIILNEWAKPMAVYKAPPWPLLPGLDTERGHRAWELEFMRRRLSWWIFLDNTAPEPDPPTMMMMGQGEPDPDEIRFTAISDVNVQPLEMTLRLEDGSNRVGETWAVYSADWVPSGGWPEGPPGPWERASEPWTLAAGTNEWVWTDEGQLDRALFTNVPLRVYAAGSLADSDGDGLADGDEWFIYGTDPFNADTDGDWFSDGYEVQQNSSPVDSNSVPTFQFGLVGADLYVANRNIQLDFSPFVADEIILGASPDPEDVITIPFAPTVEYALPDEDGWHIVRARLSRTSDGAVSPPLGVQVALDRSPPSLAVTNLASIATANARWVSLEGTIEDQFPSVSVTVNGAHVHELYPDRFKHARVLLEPGTNDILIVATDLAGNTANVTQQVILDTTGDETAPVAELFLPPDLLYSGMSTQTLDVTTLASNESLYVSGSVDDETALIRLYAVQGGVTNASTTPVLQGSLFWGQIALMPGENTLVLTAEDAAGNRGESTYSVIRDMSFGLQITNPAPYAALGAPQTIVSGTASPQFADADIFINGVPATIEVFADHVRFTTQSPVDLDSGLTALVGFAYLDGRRYYFDPPPYGYDIRERINKLRKQEVSHGYFLGNLIIPWKHHITSESRVWNSIDRETVFQHIKIFQDCTFAGCVATHSNTPAPQVTPSESIPSFEVRMGTKSEVTGLNNFLGLGLVQHTIEDYEGSVRFVKEGPEATTQLVVLRLTGFPDRGVPEQFTLWGQPGLIEPPAGYTSFLVPVEVGTEYVISTGSFIMPERPREPVTGINYFQIPRERRIHFQQLSNTELKVEIKAGNGSGAPSAFLSPGSTTNFTAIVTPDVPGAFVWSVNDEERLQLSSTTGSTVTVTVPADAEASADIGAETLTVTFTPTGLDHAIEATHALTVIKVEIEADKTVTWPCGNPPARVIVGARASPNWVQGNIKWTIEGETFGSTLDPGYPIGGNNPVPPSGYSSYATIIPGQIGTGTLTVRASLEEFETAYQDIYILVHAVPVDIIHTMQDMHAQTITPYARDFKHRFASSGGSLDGVVIWEQVTLSEDPFEDSSNFPILYGTDSGFWTLDEYGWMDDYDRISDPWDHWGRNLNRFLPSPCRPGLPAIMITPQSFAWECPLPNCERYNEFMTHDILTGFTEAHPQDCGSLAVQYPKYLIINNGSEYYHDYLSTPYVLIGDLAIQPAVIPPDGISTAIAVVDCCWIESPMGIPPPQQWYWIHGTDNLGCTLNVIDNCSAEITAGTTSGTVGVQVFVGHDSCHYRANTLDLAE